MPCWTQSTLRSNVLENIIVITRYYPAVFCSVMLLAGCSTHLPDVNAVKSQLALPAKWRNALPEGKDIKQTQHWWRSFQDPDLDALVERVLRNNNNLAAAAYRVKKAEAQAGIVRTNLTPGVSSGFKLSSSKELNRGSSEQKAFTSTFSLSYELDLWGRLAKARDISAWEAMATREDREHIAMQLIGTTMELYWRLAFLNESIEINDTSIASARSILELARLGESVGQEGRLQSIQAEQQLSVLLADKTGRLQQREESRNALLVLLASPMGWDDTIKIRPVPTQPSTALRSEIPAHILSQRPDMRAAELRLRAHFSNIEIQQRNLYPAVNLTAGITGGGTRELSNILRNPVGFFTADLLLPFFEFNKGKLQVEIAEATYQESIELYKKQLLDALQDVENALSAYKQLTDEGLYLARAHESSSRAERIAEIRYRLGQSNIKEWLDQQDAKRSIELRLGKSRTDRLIAMVKFHQSIGGGCGDGCADALL